MVAVLVHDGVRVVVALLGRDDHHVARVAAGCIAAAGRAELVPGDDVHSHRRDLVAMRRGAQERCVPLGVDTLDVDVEADRAALVVREDDFCGACLACEDERQQEQRQEETAHRANRREASVRGR